MTKDNYRIIKIKISQTIFRVKHDIRVKFYKMYKVKDMAGGVACERFEEVIQQLLTIGRSRVLVLVARKDEVLVSLGIRVLRVSIGMSDDTGKDVMSCFI